MSMMVSKEKLIYDPAEVADSDNVGVYLKDGAGNALTSTLISGKQALDVNLVGGADSGIFAEDSAHVSGDKGQFILSVRHDANTSLVDTDGDYAPLQVDASGRLKVAAVVSVEPSDAEYAEDSAAANGDTLISVGAVRQDTLASSVSTDGDYAWFKLNSRGALWSVPVGTVADDAADNENPVKIGSRAVAGPLAAVSSNDRADAVSDLYRRIYVNNGSNIAVKNTAVGITDTAAVLVAAALGGRRQLMIQNLSNKEIFVGPAAVATTDGWRIAAGAAFGIELGENVALYAVAANPGPYPVRVLEVA